MRITVSHKKSKQEVMRAVDRSFEDVFRGLGPLPLQVVNEKRIWNGSMLTFSFEAKVGFLSTPVKGTVDVTDKDLTIDADLGLLERLIPGKKTSEAIETRVRGLLT